MVHGALGKLTEAISFADLAGELCMQLKMPPRIATTRLTRSALCRVLGRILRESFPRPDGDEAA